MTNADQISFSKYRPPPNISRGVCRKCQKAVAELGPFKSILIPSGNFESQELLPPAQMHIFYRSRVKDAQDDLPKYNGYFRSELAVIGTLLWGV